MHRIFVFGSNLAGRHGAGAALHALTYWGAVRGVGEGPQGSSYGIPTKDERLDTRSLRAIKLSVDRFIEYAIAHSDLTFQVTRIGCGLAGYKDEDIFPMLVSAPSNCLLPEGWRS